MAKDKGRQICIVTVTGRDKVGIIARISTLMAKANVNIVDVSQRIMEEYFVMTMACDVTDAAIELDKLQKQLARMGREMELNITFQHENIFKMMHRV
ncbi:MAG: ACT domain-containing protein [Planctomycetaceae bacterium]|nr:ACT domain-containing protein [Planctomycetaceae bacterium]